MPIVFVRLSILSAPALLTSLAQPGGNVTGFLTYEYSLGGKWLELLKQIAPRIARVALLRDPAVSFRDRSSARSKTLRNHSGWR